MQYLFEDYSCLCNLLFFSYIADQADGLKLATPLPASIGVGDALPDLEVHIMSSTRTFPGSTGERVPFPLLHGPDTNLDITLTISWNSKVQFVAI